MAVAVAAALCVLWAMCAPLAHADGAFQRGFVVTGWTTNSYLTARSDTKVQRMANDGSTNAAIFTEWFMDTPTSSAVAPDPARTASDASVLHAIEVAHAAGMEVTLKPQITIRTGDWLGDAHPADPDAFWTDYRTMLLHYADLAQQSGVEMLVIGTEMRTLSWDQAHWRPLIAEVRRHFHGALTYAANFDEFERVGFWDALDYVGIDAYFGLADETDPAPSVAQLGAAWRSRGYLGRIAAVSARTGKKVLFTEIGYRGMHETATAPQLWDAVGETDTQAQANAYQAVYDAVATQPWMAGLYWWSVDVDSWWVQDYSPLGKPAEQVMAAWNHGVRSQPPPPAAPRAPVAAPRPQPRTISLELSGRRLSGRISPYARVCAGRVHLHVRLRKAGGWRALPAPAVLTPGAGGRFRLQLRRGRLRVRAGLSSSCGRVRSGWVESPLRQG